MCEAEKFLRELHGDPPMTKEEEEMAQNQMEVKLFKFVNRRGGLK